MDHENSGIKGKLTLYYFRFVITVMGFTFIRLSSLSETGCGERAGSGQEIRKEFVERNEGL